MAGKSLEVLRRRIAVLKSFQSRLLWPPVTELEAFGQSFPLPFRHATGSSTVLPQPLLSYLAGFFDGDGYVGATTNGICRLGVSQATPRQEILGLFAKTFGGTVYTHKRGRGLCQPTLQWVITGQAAEMAASKLATACVVKSLQLRTAATWPVQKNLRLDAKRRLIALNRHSHYNVAHHRCSWAYIAGFFDAEGYIKCEALQNTVRLSVSQKNQSILHWMDSYWRADLDCASSWSVQRASGVTEVTICRQSDSRLLMRRLLDNGLFLKKPQALLGLSTEDVPYMEVRDRIGRLSGNQARYQTLSREGCQRAREISRLHQLAKRRQAHGKSDEVAALLQQLRGMQQEHVRLNALHIYRSLRCDIRRLLVAGAKGSPSSVAKSGPVLSEV